MRFTRRQQIFIAAGVIGLAAITSLSTVLIAGAVRDGQPGAEPSYGSVTGQGESAEAPRGRRDAGAQGATGAATNRLSLDQLYIPNEGEELMRWQWRFYRNPKSQWDDVDFSRYWIDPSEISIEYLVEENDELVEEIFESVP